MKIASIITVYNRREKTLGCLHRLYTALETYNETKDQTNEHIELTVFITDDGCTDGTADAVRASFTDKDIQIIQGTGNLFWAGGMRLAWQTAIDSGIKWDYYLLLNDDTYIYNNVFDMLFEADDYGYSQTGKRGLSSGATCKPGNPGVITYGGFNFISKAKVKSKLVSPKGEPQSIDMSHANILLVHHTLTDSIGIFYKGYRHGGADFDYARVALRHGFPVSLTSEVCGECDCDHFSNKEEIQKLCRMTLAERKKYFNSPTRSNHDFFLYVKRNTPMRYPFTLFVRTIRLYCPSLYYHLTNLRGVYKS